MGLFAAHGARLRRCWFVAIAAAAACASPACHATEVRQTTVLRAPHDPAPPCEAADAVEGQHALRAPRAQISLPALAVGHAVEWGGLRIKHLEVHEPAHTAPEEGHVEPAYWETRVDASDCAGFLEREGCYAGRRSRPETAGTWLLRTDRHRLKVQRSAARGPVRIVAERLSCAASLTLPLPAPGQSSEVWLGTMGVAQVQWRGPDGRGALTLTLAGPFEIPGSITIYANAGEARTDATLRPDGADFATGRRGDVSQPLATGATATLDGLEISIARVELGPGTRFVNEQYTSEGFVDVAVRVRVRRAGPP